MNHFQAVGNDDLCYRALSLIVVLSLGDDIVEPAKYLAVGQELGANHVYQALHQVDFLPRTICGFALSTVSSD